MERFVQYCGWSIDAVRVVTGKMFRSSAIIERLADGERFIFSELGDRQVRCEACERAIEWVKRWIDDNDRHEPVRIGDNRRRLAHRVP